MADPNEPTHEWTHSTPRVRADGTRISAGDEFSPTDHELRCWPDRMAVLDDASPICGYETDDGDPCQNPVDSPDERCWQHIELVTDGEGESEADGESKNSEADDGE